MKINAITCLGTGGVIGALVLSDRPLYGFVLGTIHGAVALSAYKMFGKTAVYAYSSAVGLFYIVKNCLDHKAAIEVRNPINQLNQKLSQRVDRFLHPSQYPRSS